MMQTVDMKNAEKQVFRLATFEDGLWEIYLGLFFTVMSFYSLTRELLGPALNAALVLGICLFLVGLVWIAKKSITQPRLGRVKFGTRTQQKIRTASLVTWGLVIATFALMILGSRQLLNEPTWERLPQWFSDFDVDLFFALLIVATFSLIAYATGARRFYFYGLLLGVSNFMTTVLSVYNDVKFGWPVALAGLIITAVGVSVLIRFFQDYSVSSEETVDG
jgi:hypothetical protein